MDYSTLQSDIAAWMNRTDLAAQIPGFIRIAETRINLDLRALQMLRLDVLTQAAGQSELAVPADWLEWDSIAVNGQALEYVSPLVMQQYARSGRPDNHYTMVGTQLILGGGAPAADQPVDVSYWQAITPAEQAVNWLMTQYPAVYLYGSLTSGFAYIKDDGAAGQYAGAFQALVTDINSNATKARVSGSQWRQRAR